MQSPRRRGLAGPRQSKQAKAKKPRAKPVSLYGVEFEEVIRRLVSTPPVKKKRQ